MQVVGYENYKDGFQKQRKTGIGRKISKFLAGSDAKTLYAVAVHEDKEAHHDVGESEFLKNAVDAEMPKLEKYLAKYIRVDK